MDLPEKADVVIQETIGPLAFDENFLSTLQDAKKRFLKRRAKIIPEAVALIGAPVDRRKEFLSRPMVLAAVRTKKLGPSEISIRKNFAAKNTKTLKNFQGILVWPKVLWAKNCLTDCSPLQPPTHWGQTLLPISKKSARTSEKTGGKNIRLALNIAPDPKACEIICTIAPSKLI